MMFITECQTVHNSLKTTAHVPPCVWHFLYSKPGCLSFNNQLLVNGVSPADHDSLGAKKHPYYQSEHLLQHPSSSCHLYPGVP